MSESFPGYTKEAWKDLPAKERKKLVEGFATNFRDMRSNQKYAGDSNMTLFLILMQKYLTQKTKSKTIDLMRIDLLNQVCKRYVFVLKGRHLIDICLFQRAKRNLGGGKTSEAVKKQLQYQEDVLNEYQEGMPSVLLEKSTESQCNEPAGKKRPISEVEEVESPMPSKAARKYYPAEPAPESSSNQPQPSTSKDQDVPVPSTSKAQIPEAETSMPPASQDMFDDEVEEATNVLQEVMDDIPNEPEDPAAQFLRYSKQIQSTKTTITLTRNDMQMIETIAAEETSSSGGTESFRDPGMEVEDKLDYEPNESTVTEGNDEGASLVPSGTSPAHGNRSAEQNADLNRSADDERREQEPPENPEPQARDNADANDGNGSDHYSSGSSYSDTGSSDSDMYNSDSDDDDDEKNPGKGSGANVGKGKKLIIRGVKVPHGLTQDEFIDRRVEQLEKLRKLKALGAPQSR